MNPKTHARCLALLFTVLAVAVAAAIFVMTEQSPEVTTAESGRVNELLIRLFGGTGWYDPETGLWLGIGIRHWAHSVEFGMLGLCVALAMRQWLRLRPARRPLLRTAGLSLAICAAYSLFDQCHKLFVPGRHFDAFDLVMDALGYIPAVLIVIAVSALAMGRTRSIITEPR